MAIIGSNKIANIEIQDYVIRYAEAKGKKPNVVTNCREYYLPTGIIEDGEIINEQLFLKALKYCVRKWKLRRKKVRLIVPDTSVIIRTIEVDGDIPDEELNGHVYFELGHSIHLPFENPVVDTVPIESNEETKKVLVVAAPSEVVEQYNEYFKDEKMFPVAADVSALCQYRLFHQYRKTETEDSLILIQMDVKSVTVSIFEQEFPVFMQQVNIPYQEDTWKVVPLNQGGYLTKDQFDEEKVFSAFEEVFSEIERILRFYQYSLNNGDKEVTKSLITGDHPFLIELMEKIGDRVNIPVDYLPPENVQAAKGVSIGNQFYNVIGLSMKEGV